MFSFQWDGRKNFGTSNTHRSNLTSIRSLPSFPTPRHHHRNSSVKTCAFFNYIMEMNAIHGIENPKSMPSFSSSWMDLHLEPEESLKFTDQSPHNLQPHFCSEVAVFSASRFVPSLRATCASFSIPSAAWATACR